MAKSKSKSVFSCQNCGAQFPKWQGQCTECGKWSTVQEEVAIVAKDEGRGWALGKDAQDSSKTIRLDQSIQEVKLDRVSTGYSELDRSLGGGLVPGSFILLGGDPGIGKSTLLMQMAGGLAKNSQEVLYVSSEESVSQTGLRAQRLKVTSEKVTVASENNLEVVMNLAKKHKPNVLIVDSIQTMYLPHIASAPGSVSQVRECAGQLMVLAKNNNISIFMIGHVTKDGSIAGPKVLEHMVDTVLSFEGDMNYQFRLLRSLKNRFGATHQLGVFTMNHKGLEEVANPSELFLEDRGEDLIGSSVFAAMEGTRPLLCEVQALSSISPMAMPRRTSIGFPTSRLHLLIAVLDKYLPCELQSQEVYVNVVGGLKLEETAADLAVSASLLSTEGNQALDSGICFFGELGLTGEVRAVSFADHRILEAQKLGFTKFVVPFSNKKHLKDLDPKILQNIFFVRHIRDLQGIFKNPPLRKSRGRKPNLQPQA